MVVREGSNVTLKCAATGSPAPTITWRREGGDLITLAGGLDGKNLIFVYYIRTDKHKSGVFGLSMYIG